MIVCAPSFSYRKVYIRSILPKNQAERVIRADPVGNLLDKIRKSEPPPAIPSQEEIKKTR